MTVIKDAAGRYFASFVVQTVPDTPPKAEPVIGIDLGLIHFAVLSDGRWSAFTAMLEYKARRYGREFRRISRFEPTSQVCSACGANDGRKPLHIRTWQCQRCWAWLDRDINAAVNVARAAGLAVTACGAQVRPGAVPAQRGEAGTHPKPRRDAA